MRPQTLFSVTINVTNQQDADDIMNACRILDCSFEDLVWKALEQYINLNI